MHKDGAHDIRYVIFANPIPREGRPEIASNKHELSWLNGSALDRVIGRHELHTEAREAYKSFLGQY